MRLDKTIKADPADSVKVLAEAMAFIRGALAQIRIAKRSAAQAELMVEESLISLMEHADFSKNEAVRVRVTRLFGNVTVELAVPGDSFDPGSKVKLDPSIGEVSDDTAAAFRDILLRSFADRLIFRYKHGYNHVHLTVSRSAFAASYPTLGALVLSIILGISLKAFAPGAVCTTLDENLLVPVRTLFLNGLKMCSVPVVFLSIASCISQFGNLSEIKAVFLRLMKYFFLIQMIAIGIGMGIIAVFNPGSGVSIAPAASSEADAKGTMSVTDTLVNLMPDNIIRPFLEGEMLQLILLAVFVGMSVVVLDAKAVRGIIDECKDITMKITAVLMRFIPLMVFCSFTSLLLTTGTETLISLLSIVIAINVGYAVLAFTYHPLVALFGHLDPKSLYTKSVPVILTAFSTVSSSATIPESISTAKKLGISPKVYSLAVPLGASINKAALCLCTTASCLFLCRINGVEVSSVAMIFMIFYVLMSVIGAATVPGGGLITISVILAQLGCPAESIGLLMGIFPIFDMIGTPVSCLGTMASALLAAADGKMLDIEAYKA